MAVSLVFNGNVVSAARDLVPTSKKPLPFTNCKKPTTIKIPKYESDRHGICDESTNYVFCGLLGKRPLPSALLRPRLGFFLISEFA